MNKPHNQAEFIKLWAEGETIQFRTKDVLEAEWFEVTGGHYWKDSLEYRIKPYRPNYPQTMMTASELKRAFHAANGETEKGWRGIANAAIARAIEDYQVVIAEESKATVGRAFEQAKSLARQGMVPAEMLEKVYHRVMEVAADRLQYKSWTASLNGYDPSAKRIILDELLNINKQAIITAVKEGK